MRSSPAINLGDNTWLADTYQGAVLGLLDGFQKDFAENPRVRDFECDAGAHEFQPPTGTVIVLR